MTALCELYRVYFNVLVGWCYIGACRGTATAVRASVHYQHRWACWVYCQCGSCHQAWCRSGNISCRW